MTTNNEPGYLRSVLERFQGVRRTTDGWVACCPCPGHGDNGDQNASLRVTLGGDGRILIKCRVGCPTDSVLDACSLDWSDLFQPTEGNEPASLAALPVCPAVTSGDKNGSGSRPVRPWRVGP